MAEHQYKEFSYAFTSKGLAARFAIDKVPDGMFWNHLGVETRQEDALSTRLGKTPLTVQGPGTATQTATVGTSAAGSGSAWFNPGGVTGNISQASTVIPFPSLVSNELQATAFGFTLLLAAIVQGIEISFGGGSSDTVPLITVQLLRNGTPVATKQVIINNTFQTYVLGSPTDLWGVIWQTADFNSATWGVQISISGQDSSSTTNINNVQATIFYSGSQIPNPLPDTNVHTLARLKGTAGNTWRYAGAGQNIYRITGDLPGPYSRVSALNQMSGSRFSTATYRPPFSSFPYIFFADSNAMLKDNGTFNPLQQMGIFPPVIPVTAQVVGILANQIDNFGSPQFPTAIQAGYQFWGTPPKAYSNIPASITITSPTFTRTEFFVGGRRYTTVLVNTAVPHGLLIGQQVLVSGVPDSSFDGSFLVAQVNSANSFTIVVPNAPNASSSGGTITSYETYSKVNTTVVSVSQSGSIVTVKPASMTNIVTGLVLSVSNTGGLIVTSVTGTTFSFNAVTGLPTINPGDPVMAGPFSSSIAPSTTASIIGTGPFNLNVLGSTQATDSDTISAFFNFLTLANLTSVTVEFDVGDGTFTNDYYSTSVPLGGFTAGVWGQFSATRGSFTKNGRAGLPGFTWATVNSYRVLFVTSAGTPITIQMDSFYMAAVGGPDVGPGSQYDYRYTYFNAVTGEESNPSMVMAYTVDPTNQAVVLMLVPSTDPQVTNINIYRRGGTLNSGWFFLAQVPANTTSFVDQAPDSQIASNDLLSLTNDVPLTTDLPVPVNTILGTNVTAGSTQTVTPGSMANIWPNQQITVDTGANQEIVIVQSTTATTFTAYFQLAHSISTPITASTRSGHPVNLMTVAFDIAWFAGDEDNPNRLYYSNIGNPEAVPAPNWIEIGTPSDPIMAIVFFSGQLFVLTLSRIYRVIIPYPGAVPAPYPTASRHGLTANFAFCISEGLIPYLATDGMYIFVGGDSNYASEVIEWILSDKEPNLGPVPSQDPALADNSIMAFTKNEFYMAYNGLPSDVLYRLSYDFRRNRWRNDDVQATAMYYEEDTNDLVIGTGDGMIYLDREGDFDVSPDLPDNKFFNAPINVNLQTGAMDQGLPLNNKVYNELTLDMDCPDPVNVSLIFDSGATTLNLGAFSTSGRQRIPIPINQGVGQLSQNVSLQLQGGLAINGPAHFYKWHIKAAVEAEYRESFDSYWAKFGTDEFKFVKQGWFEYVAPDPAGIAFSVYTEGNLSVPVFTFTLPQATVRTARRIRFPATMAKVWRFIATSPTQFQLYGESFIEYKVITMAKGYAKENLGAMITAQGSV